MAATLRLGLEIFPRPTEGIVRYARSRPWSTSLAIIATSTILFPLSKWLAVKDASVKTFLSGLLAVLLAHGVLGLVLVAGLRVHFRRAIVARELLGTFAASQLPFIPALLVGWMLAFVKTGPDLYQALQTIGLILAAMYLSTALRELYALSADGALYFASICYGTWLIVFSAGVLSV